ncbi:MAG: glycoside hydrolase family 3 C-terminal domain-containing protein [Candidatus Marinimicrobia bacterium]|nr:glycoside hydrolase family 3 C-terminal domain-containing protein [Candidatus Neomarinimicrobiota bacterium]
MRNLTIALLTILMNFAMLMAIELDPGIEKQINDILAQMTLEEKANMLGGDTTGFDSKPLAHLGIPALRMTDGPNGVRWGKATSFPVGVCMAATWDTSLVHELGQALGRETKAQGRNVLLGPCVNIHRDPHAGRNFESYGEDPYLAARMAVNWVKGLQSEQIIATTKHFAVNNQEFERNSMDSRVDERVLREIYFPAFKAAVQEGGTWAVMSSYNRVNGQYASSNTWLLNDVLKDEWGFKGFVMSDWGAVHSIVPTMYAGLDIEMPNGKYLNTKNVVQAINEGRMKESRVDEKIRRMLRSMLAMNLFENEIPQGGAVHTPEHLDIARRVAEAGIVLLKNQDQILPLNTNKIKSIAVLGPNAGVLRTGGGGSSKIDPIEAQSPFEALIEAAPDLEISYSPGMFIPSDLKPIPADFLSTGDGKPGLDAKYFGNPDFVGPAIKHESDAQIDFDWGRKGPESVGIDNFSIEWSGKLTAPADGKYYLGTHSDDGSRVYINNQLVVDNWGDHAMTTQIGMVELSAQTPVDIRVTFYEHGGDAGVRLLWQKVKNSPMEQAIELAQTADAALLFLGFSDQYESEGFDRRSNALPQEQLEMLEKVCAVNNEVVVVINSGAGILMDEWEPKVDAIIESWYPGEQGGVAIANILMGTVNPSGKLITSFFKEETDTPTFKNYPGADDELNYEEGLFVGYRHYDKMNIETLYPFGHGLSYTTFEYSDLKLSSRRIRAGESIQVSVNIKNSGEVPGAEVVQLYLSDTKSSVIRPQKELKGFSKIQLQPGEEKRVTMTLKAQDLMFWDRATGDWKAEAGKFTVMVGASSRDIRLNRAFRLR